jgi:hypothetical protein
MPVVLDDLQFDDWMRGRGPCGRPAHRPAQQYAAAAAAACGWEEEPSQRTAAEMPPSNVCGARRVFGASGFCDHEVSPELHAAVFLRHHYCEADSSIASGQGMQSAAPSPALRLKRLALAGCPASRPCPLIPRRSADDDLDGCSASAVALTGDQGYFMSARLESADLDARPAAERTRERR